MKKKPAKRKNRKKVPYPGLEPEYNLKIRQEELYIDYKNKLSEDEKRWLNKFNEEYVSASLDTKKLKNNLHRTKKLKKDCQDRNNNRNADVYGNEKKNNNLRYVEDLKENEHPSISYEDMLIDAIE
jgi:hypothetical protein